jgi:hypothetical protein
MPQKTAEFVGFTVWEVLASEQLRRNEWSREQPTPPEIRKLRSFSTRGVPGMIIAELRSKSITGRVKS